MNICLHFLKGGVHARQKGGSGAADLRVRERVCRVKQCISELQGDSQRHWLFLRRECISVYQAHGGEREIRNCRRGVSTGNQSMDIVRVPVIGYVACGSPVLTEECIDGYIPLRREDLGSGKFFALHASGRSMIGAGIEDGDLVIVRRQETAEPGQIVVALVGNAVTLKRFYPELQSGLVCLHPENKRMKDIIVEDYQIQGMAVKVLKELR